MTGVVRASSQTSTDYDSKDLAVRPQDLYDVASDVERTGNSLSGHASAILKALASLTSTGWDSDAADLVVSFTHEIAASFDDVFGSDGTDLRAGRSATGALPAYVGYLKGAADAYDAVDHDLGDRWTKFLAALGSQGGADPLAGMGPAHGAVVGGPAVRPLDEPVIVQKSSS